MVQDKELDEIMLEKEAQQTKNENTQNALQKVVPNAVEESNTPTAFSPTAFAEKMDEVKENVLQNAATEDQKFVETIKENVKHAAVGYTEVEKEKANLNKQAVQYEQEKLATKQQSNEFTAVENKWTNAQKKREFHYNGVKPIMEYVHIKEPMNLILLYILTVIFLPWFIVAKLFKGTIGALISGASDADRPKAVRGYLWTLLASVTTCVIALGVYMFLKWQNII